MAETLWTDADIDKLKAAILALGTGTSVLTVRYSGPPAREVTYQQQDLASMRDLLAFVRAEVRAATGTRRTYRHARIKKGT